MWKPSSHPRKHGYYHPLPLTHRLDDFVSFVTGLPASRVLIITHDESLPTLLGHPAAPTTLPLPDEHSVESGFDQTPPSNLIHREVGTDQCFECTLHSPPFLIPDFSRRFLHSLATALRFGGSDEQSTSVMEEGSSAVVDSSVGDDGEEGALPRLIRDVFEHVIGPVLKERGARMYSIHITERHHTSNAEDRRRSSDVGDDDLSTRHYPTPSVAFTEDSASVDQSVDLMSVIIKVHFKTQGFVSEFEGSPVHSYLTKQLQLDTPPVLSVSEADSTTHQSAPAEGSVDMSSGGLSVTSSASSSTQRKKKGQTGPKKKGAKSSDAKSKQRKKEQKARAEPPKNDDIKEATSTPPQPTPPVVVTPPPMKRDKSRVSVDSFPSSTPIGPTLPPPSSYLLPRAMATTSNDTAIWRPPTLHHCVHFSFILRNSLRASKVRKVLRTSLFPSLLRSATHHSSGKCAPRDQ